MKGIAGLIVVIFLLVVVSAAVWWWFRVRRGHDARFHRLLKAHSTAWVRELYIPDGLDGQIHVPHVLRTRAGFVVIDVIHVHGWVFGGDNIDEWTVMVDGRSRKFRNPAATNRVRTLAVRGLVPEVSVHGLVVFLGKVEFPKGKPEAVVTLESLAGALMALPAAGRADSAWDDAWYGLAACATAPPGPA